MNDGKKIGQGAMMTDGKIIGRWGKKEKNGKYVEMMSGILTFG